MKCCADVLLQQSFKSQPFVGESNSFRQQIVYNIGLELGGRLTKLLQNIYLELSIAIAI